MKIKPGPGKDRTLKKFSGRARAGTLTIQTDPGRDFENSNFLFVFPEKNASSQTPMENIVNEKRKGTLLYIWLFINLQKNTF